MNDAKNNQTCGINEPLRFSQSPKGLVTLYQPEFQIENDSINHFAVAHAILMGHIDVLDASTY